MWKVGAEWTGQGREKNGSKQRHNFIGRTCTYFFKILLPKLTLSKMTILPKDYTESM